MEGIRRRISFTVTVRGSTNLVKACETGIVNTMVECTINTQHERCRRKWSTQVLW